LARYFFDSSALAKRYHPELGTPKVLSIFAEPGREIRISKLSFIEIQSVFAMKVRSGVIGRDDAGVQRARLIAEIAAGEIEVCAVTANLFDDAAKLIGRHSFSHRLRTLDALQLAVALDLSKQGLLDQFVVSDRALAEVAIIEGLIVISPEVPQFP
jgi:predicted nucleic acid-binding protein